MVLTDKLRRLTFLSAALLLSFGSFAAILTAHMHASAYGLLTSRNIKIDSSVASATDVTYKVGVTTPSTQTIGSMAIEFCSNSPIIGDSCTAPAGFDINEAGLVLANQTGITDWQIDASTTTNVLVLTRTGGPASFTAGAISVDLGAGGATDGVTNPSATNTTFYARILTFADDDDDGNGCSGVDDSATCYPTTAISGNSLHAGGIALSTAAQITVTAKVQERLTFCVFTVDGTPSDTCGATTPVSGTSIALGDNNGVLNENEAFVNKSPKFSIYTNASSGAIVRSKAQGPDYTLSSGSFTISAVAAGNGTGATSTPGSEQFGFCAYQSTGSGLTLAAPYNDSVACAGTTNTAGNAPGSGGGDNGAIFGFDTTTGGENLTTQYGDVVATKPAGNFSTATLPFLGNIATTTEPGIYTATLMFIATGTY